MVKKLGLNKGKKKYYEKNSPKTPYNYPASFWISNLQEYFFEDPKIHHVLIERM